MNKIKLSKRLLKISKLVAGDVICDVGCDHGKLSFYLLKNKITKFAYVSDISKPSLKKAEDLLSSENLSFESIHCDGLTKFDGKHIDECIIAGMGGSEIIKIISSSPIDINAYILSPQHNIIEVKKFMINNGYNIIYDKLFKDGHKFYNIFKCVKGDCFDYNEINLHFGKDYCEEEKTDIKEYLSYQLEKNSMLCNNVDDTKKMELKKYIELIKKVQKDWNL